jgi:signal transduction histidine kinase
MAALIAGHYPAWRVAAVGVAEAAIIVTRRLMMRRPVEKQIFTGWLVILLGTATMAACSGGMSSPLLPQFVGAPFGAILTYGRSKRSVQLLPLVIVVNVVVALLPPAIRGPMLPNPWYALALGLSATLVVVMARTAYVSLSDAYERNRQELERMREAVLDDARLRVRSLETIGARVGHELKNPLTAIKGLLPLLFPDGNDERSKERFEVVRQQVNRMEETVRGYLSFSRPLDDLQLESVVVVDLIRDVFGVLEGRAHAAGVTLELDGDVVAIEGDTHRLRDALINLVSNAIDATPRNGLVHVSACEDRERTRVDIADNGRGMTPEVLSRLGRPFFTTKEHGTGLGVVLARGTVEQHGGSLTFASTVGRGTTATIVLPARVPETARRKPLSRT